MDENTREKIQAERDIENNRACQLAYDGKFDEAIKIFDELLATDPKDSRAMSNKIIVTGKSGRYAEAVDLFENHFSGGGTACSQISHINLLTYMGKYELALECRQRIGRLPPMTYMLLGSLSKDFHTLQQIASRGGTMEEIVKEMEKYRSEVNGGKPSEKSPKFLSLIMAGPPSF